MSLVSRHTFGIAFDGHNIDVLVVSGLVQYNEEIPQNNILKGYIHTYIHVYIIYHTCTHTTILRNNGLEILSNEPLLLGTAQFHSAWQRSSLSLHVFEMG